MRWSTKMVNFAFEQSLAGERSPVEMTIPEVNANAENDDTGYKWRHWKCWYQIQMATSAMLEMQKLDAIIDIVNIGFSCNQHLKHWC